MARIPASLRRTITETAQGICAYCRSPEKLMSISFEIDHIVSRSGGGKTIVDNLCLSCPTCNRHKANRSRALDPVSRHPVPLFHPKRDQWPEHFSWGDDFSQIFGLTPTGRATAEALQFNRPAMTTLRQYWQATGIRLDE